MSHKFFPIGGRQLFDGGLNSKYAPSIIENNESSDCLNVVFDAGAVETRKGTAILNTTSVGSFAVDGLYTYRNNTLGETMCVFAGDLMYVLSGTTFYTVPSAQSVFAHSNRVAGAQQENYIFFCNGQTSPYKYNGSFTQMGVSAPVATATVVSNGAGFLTGSGQYQYAYTWVNSNVVEGNISPISSTFTISSTSGQNTLNNISVGPTSAGITSRFIYRTKANTTTPFFKIGTIADNTTTTFSDNIPDASLVTAAPTDNGLPPNFTSIVYANGRLFCNNPAFPNRVHYSNLNSPYTWGALNWFTVGDNAADIVKGVAFYDQSIVCACEKSIWLNYMPSTTPTDWQQIRTNSPYGSKSPFSFVNYNNKLLFPALQDEIFVGFAALSGSTLDPSKAFLTVSTAGSDLKSDRIEPDMYLVQSTGVGNISSIVYKKKAWIALTYGTNNTTNNRVYQMDFSMSNIKKDQEMSWCPFTGINASQFCIYNGNLYFGSSLMNGFVYAAEQAAYNDAGNAINSYYWTKEYVGIEDEQGSDTNVVKDFRFSNILLDASGTYFVNITYKNDSTIGGGTVQQISVNPGGSLWGFMVWGTSFWGGGALQIEPRAYLNNSRGKRIQFRFDNQNTVNQKFKIHGLNFAYNIKGYR